MLYLPGAISNERLSRNPVGNGIQQSMSRKGNCLDNSAMDSFF